MRRNLEIELKMQRDRFRTILHSMGDGLGIVDGNYRVRFMNQVLQEWAGQEATGKECYRAYLGNDARCPCCPLQRGIEALDTKTVEVAGANGRTFLITHSPIQDEEGRTAVLEILKDVTEKKKMEERLLDSERRAILATFSSAIAHDLKNAVIGIHKAHQFLRHGHETMEKGSLTRWLADISASSELLLGLMNDMLDIFQEGVSSLKLQKSHFHFPEVVYNVLSLLKAAAEEKDLTLDFRPGPEDGMIWGDRRRLQRVAINLLDNAIKFSPRGGRVSLRSKMVFQNGFRPLYFSFSITDQGPGLASKSTGEAWSVYPRKGDPPASAPGIGMGLYFCRMIVEAHGGRILAVNRKPRGSRFTILLPVET